MFAKHGRVNNMHKDAERTYEPDGSKEPKVRAQQRNCKGHQRCYHRAVRTRGQKGPRAPTGTSTHKLSPPFPVQSCPLTAQIRPHSTDQAPPSSSITHSLPLPLTVQLYHPLSLDLPLTAQFTAQLHHPHNLDLPSQPSSSS